MLVKGFLAGNDAGVIGTPQILIRLENSDKMQTPTVCRDAAAWLGLVSRQHSGGGKERLGRKSIIGQRDIRRLLFIGAMSVVQWAKRKGIVAGSWLKRIIDRKPLMLVAIALANKMARMVWAMTIKNEAYREPAAIVA